MDGKMDRYGTDDDDSSDQDQRHTYIDKYIDCR